MYHDFLYFMLIFFYLCKTQTGKLSFNSQLKQKLIAILMSTPTGEGERHDSPKIHCSCSSNHKVMFIFQLPRRGLSLDWGKNSEPLISTDPYKFQYSTSRKFKLLPRWSSENNNQALVILFLTLKTFRLISAQITRGRNFLTWRLSCRSFRSQKQGHICYIS